MFVNTFNGIIAFTKNNDYLSETLIFRDVKELINEEKFYPAIALQGDGLITWKIPEYFPSVLNKLIEIDWLIKSIFIYYHSILITFPILAFIVYS